MKVKFYGTRGTRPTPSGGSRNISTSQYGGNTTSLKVVSGNGELYIIDAGSGIVDLGDDLIVGSYYKDGGRQHRLLLTHQHQDHIEGVPFFRPFYDPRNEFEIYSKHDPRVLEELLNGRQESYYFPVAYSRAEGREEVPALGAKKIHRCIKGGISSGGLEVSGEETNHPGGCVAYRFDEDGKVFVFGGDHEIGVEDIDKKLARFCNGVNVLVMDAHFTPQERNPEKYGLKTPPKKGWGHSDYEQVIRFALKVKPQTLVLTHHAPEHGDSSLVNMEAAAKEYAIKRGLDSNIMLAYEGLELEL